MNQLGKKCRRFTHWDDQKTDWPRLETKNKNKKKMKLFYFSGCCKTDSHELSVWGHAYIRAAERTFEKNPMPTAAAAKQVGRTTHLETDHEQDPSDTARFYNASYPFQTRNGKL